MKTIENQTLFDSPGPPGQAVNRPIVVETSDKILRSTDLAVEAAAHHKPNSLSPAECTRLAILESTIKKSKMTFLAVGNCLAAIKAERLYRASHSSFGDYVLEKFGFTRQHGFRLIQSSEVLSGLRRLSPMGDISLPLSERAFRELARIKEPADQLKVLQAVQEGAGNPVNLSAELIRSTAAKLALIKIPQKSRKEKAAVPQLTEIVSAVQSLRQAVNVSDQKCISLALTQLEQLLGIGSQGEKRRRVAITKKSHA